MKDKAKRGVYMPKYPDETYENDRQKVHDENPYIGFLTEGRKSYEDNPQRIYGKKNKRRK